LLIFIKNYLSVAITILVIYFTELSFDLQIVIFRFFD